MRMWRGSTTRASCRSSGDEAARMAGVVRAIDRTCLAARVTESDSAATVTARARADGRRGGGIDRRSAKAATGVLDVRPGRASRRRRGGMATSQGRAGRRVTRKAAGRRSTPTTGTTCPASCARCTASASTRTTRTWAGEVTSRPSLSTRWSSATERWRSQRIAQVAKSPAWPPLRRRRCRLLSQRRGGRGRGRRLRPRSLTRCYKSTTRVTQRPCTVRGRDRSGRRRRRRRAGRMHPMSVQ
jgi:hypothetical protein